MGPIFEKKDFKLCRVPVPEGYKQSQTHSGVALHEGDCYLTTSPFPSYAIPRWKAYWYTGLNMLHLNRNIKREPAERYENPCLYIGMPSSDNPPTQFRLLQSSPLMPPPDPYYDLPAFNSDPDIFIEGDIIHVLNRSVYRKEICPGASLNKYDIRLFHIHGLIDKRRFKYIGTDLLIETDKLFASPCLTKYNGKYILTELESNVYNDGKMYNGLFVALADNIADFKNEDLVWRKIDIDGERMLPWHMSLFQYKGTLYTIIACVENGIAHRLWQMLGRFSKDLKSLKIYNTPLTDYKSYRGAASVTSEGEFVLYSTTVHENIKDSTSVDGRDVIMAHAPFIEVLEQLRNNELER